MTRDADFALWQRERVRNNVLEKQLNFWRQQLLGAPAEQSLPTDHVRPHRSMEPKTQRPLIRARGISPVPSQLSRAAGKSWPQKGTTAQSSASSPGPDSR
jgi:hypothetical protein